MYIVKNALENLLRNKGRNILIMAIMFLIIATSVVALIINNTANAVIQDYQNRFSSQVSISPDMNKIRQEATSSSTSSSTGTRVALQMPTISPDQLLSFAQSDLLAKTEAYGLLPANSDTLTAVDQSTDSSTSDNSQNGMPDGAPAGGPDNGGGMTISGTDNGTGTPIMSIRGGSNFRLYGDYWDDFNNGTCSLADDGQSAMPSADNECLISQDLADLDSVSVGDTIALTTQFTTDIPSGADMSGYADGDTYTINGTDYTLSVDQAGNYRASRTQEIDLKVTGIYDNLNAAYDNDNMPQIAALNNRNVIYTTLDTLLALRQADENNITLNVTYYLKNPDDLDAFTQYVRNAGLSDDFTVTTDSTSYNTIVKPVLSLKSITLTFMIVVLALGAVILILLTTIAIRERKYEIGVLRAMGMKKSRVSLGLWSELLIMTAICLVVGIGVGVLAAQPITDVLITQQAQAAETSSTSNQPTNTQGPGGGPGGGGQMMGMGMLAGPSASNANAQPLSEMSVTIGLDSILEIIGIALVLATLAGVISTSRITKYEPIKILMERN